MVFSHDDAVWAAHPGLVAGVLRIDGIAPQPRADAALAALLAQARARLAAAPEGEWPEIQAWRRAFSAMGLKPTQYRCAAESLLRRLRKEGSLPALHPLVDACNAVSLAFATPVAVFDLARIAGDLTVRPARGDEAYAGVGGEQEPPAPGEVVFADSAGQAHARRWCHRQSARSAVQPDTRSVLVVAEALHADASAQLPRLLDALQAALPPGAVVQGRAVLRRGAPRFDCGPRLSTAAA
ncbi:B3/B4 domain-containing protein [Pseudorhodoferax sp.]|uniref:B3/B4 domain-containing protein n=1 Tax=Pseudorhodoferax sp. TaxID=1993553 RepID=UPI002DD6512E|nr:phenylalanine--tRNA ligase beta subunit-related protein [Pseudorhodoferax sp.]